MGLPRFSGPFDMACTCAYTDMLAAARKSGSGIDTAKGSLRKLDKQTVQRIVDYMDVRITGQGFALHGL